MGREKKTGRVENPELGSANVTENPEQAATVKE